MAWSIQVAHGSITHAPLLLQGQEWDRSGHAQGAGGLGVASRDKRDRRAIVAPKEGYASKGLGAGPGAGKEGRSRVVLPKGRVAQPSPAPEHMPGQGWAFEGRIQLNFINLSPFLLPLPTPSCRFPVKPVKSGEERGMTVAPDSLTQGHLALPCSVCGKKPGAWDLPLPVLSLPFQPGHLEVFSALISDAV